MDHTREFFNGYAEKWDDVNRYNRPKKDFEHLVGRLGIKKGSRVLDLGCGTGVLIPYLLEVVGSSGFIYAVDPAEKMLQNLSKKFPLENIKTLPLRAENLNLVEDKVDAVICFSTFPHIDDKLCALKEISNILKPRGRLLIAHFSSRDEINAFHAGLSEPVCHHVLPEEKEMRRIFSEAGLKITGFVDGHSQYEVLAHL